MHSSERELGFAQSASILEQFFPGAIPYGMTFLVEYAPDSIWYETSLTMAAQTSEAVETHYHTFDHAPSNVKEALTRQGVNVEEREKKDTLRVLDSYTPQIGIGLSEVPKDEAFRLGLKISDWSIASVRLMKDTTQRLHEHVHIDDDVSVFLRYNDERSVVEWVRTRALPDARNRKQLWFLAVPTGIASDSFYKQLELVCDGIIDFKRDEKAGEIKHSVRIRTVRGRKHDLRWHRLELEESGGVRLVD